MRHNIILFGEAGSGKSSVVNMIVGKDVAKVSNSAMGCTFENEAYRATIGGTTFNVYDTAGLNEGDQGRVPHWKAIQGLYMLIRQLDGVSLLIYCMRGRVKENARANWLLFNKVICAEKVPVIAVVTGLETYDDPEQWWGTEGNRGVFKRNGMKPKEVVCSVSFRGRRNEFDGLYSTSQVKLRRAIMRNHLPSPWMEEKQKWFFSIYESTFSTQLCFIPRDRVEYTEQMRGKITEVTSEAQMEDADSERLMATLLKAEKKFRKKRIISR